MKKDDYLQGLIIGW